MRLIVFVFACLFAGAALRPAQASPVLDALTGQAGGWLLFAGVVAGLFVLGAVCRQGSAYLDERAHASRVGRLLDVLASQADGIAELLLSHPPAPAATLQTVRAAAIAQSVAYVKANLPDTLKAIGVTDAVLAARLSNEIAARTAPPPVAAAASAAPVPDAAPLPAATPAA